MQKINRRVALPRSSKKAKAFYKTYIKCLTGLQTEAIKAQDNYKNENGYRIKMSDSEFAVKLRIEAHIDEIAEISKKDKKQK